LLSDDARVYRREVERKTGKVVESTQTKTQAKQSKCVKWVTVQQGKKNEMKKLLPNNY